MIPEILLEGYDINSLTVGCIGSHSALEVGYGAKKAGLNTVVVCEGGREKTYAKHYRNLFDEVMILDRFSDVTSDEAVRRLRQLNTIFVPNRSFSAYIPPDAIEHRILVPIFGNRRILRAEERTSSPNQYDLLKASAIPTPVHFDTPEDIDRLVMVKVPQARKAQERGFFSVSTFGEYQEVSNRLVQDGQIKQGDLEAATIEEFVVGAQFNLNYFYSPLTQAIEFVGADQRIESNIEGILRLTAKEQASVVINPTLIPVGHRGVTIRESLLDQVFDMGERFVDASTKLFPPGVIGPFALQGIFTDQGKFICFDASLRVPGAPILLTTSPYTKYRYGKDIGIGERIAQEIKQARDQSKLQELVT